MKNNILIVDDDEDILSSLSMLLRANKYQTVSVQSPQAALEELSVQDYLLVLMDLNYSLDTTSGDEGLKLIKLIREIDECVPIVVMTGWGTIEIAVQSIKLGANDFIKKPWGNERLLSVIHTQIKLYEVQTRSNKLIQQNQLLLEEISPKMEIVAESKSMRVVLDLIHQVAKSDANVLLTGENGTGKSMYAKYLHSISEKKSGHFVSVNIGAMAESLFESEMFGHVKGAFTDAKSSRIGRFELADNGSLFLDEIANINLTQQSRLLRVLEDRQFEKVGSSRTQNINIRLICATNSDLACDVEEGRFRQDLLYRINTVEIKIPALRERKEDINILAKMFLKNISYKYKKPIKSLSEDAILELESYLWPGNVRELAHLMERSYILSNSDVIDVGDLGISPDKKNYHNLYENQTTNNQKTFDEIEMDIIEKRLHHFDGDALRTAKSLGLSKSAFYRRLEKCKINKN